MPADLRPLPLVTADGPVCNAACEHFVVSEYSPERGRLCTAGLVGGGMHAGHTICVAGAVAAWLREQARKLEVCGRCEHYRRRIGGEMDCYFNSTLNPWSASESCSRFKERKDA